MSLIDLVLFSMMATFLLNPTLATNVDSDRSRIVINDDGDYDCADLEFSVTLSADKKTMPWSPKETYILENENETAFSCVLEMPNADNHAILKSAQVEWRYFEGARESYFPAVD